MLNYDPRDWRSHLFDLHGSMLREICARVLTCTIWCVAVVVLHFELIHPLGRTFSLPESAHALVGGALALLLVFRTNSSYDRFWEGRKQWGAIVNECRNLARGAGTYLAESPDIMRSVVLWTAAFAWSVQFRLRGQSAIGEIAALLPADDVRSVIESNHPPLAASRQITRWLAEAHRRGMISDIVLTHLDQNVQLLVDYMGACERIQNTPLPFAYMVHLRRALILYCFTLPFALIDRFGWMSIVAVLLISYVLYGIEEIGVEIENPFGEDENDLPLELFCRTIEANLRGVIDTVPAGATANIAAGPRPAESSTQRA